MARTDGQLHLFGKHSFPSSRLQAGIFVNAGALQRKFQIGVDRILVRAVPPKS